MSKQKSNKLLGVPSIEMGGRESGWGRSLGQIVRISYRGMTRRVRKRRELLPGFVQEENYLGPEHLTRCPCSLARVRVCCSLWFSEGATALEGGPLVPAELPSFSKVVGGFSWKWGQTTAWLTYTVTSSFSLKLQQLRPSPF